MSSNKRDRTPSGDFGFGEILLPIIELMNILVLKLMQGFGELVWFLWQKYTNASPPIKKIERRFLDKGVRSQREDVIGYSVNKKRLILGEEIDKSAHTAIVGASGSGKTVLLDALMFEDMRQGKPVVYIDPKGDIETLKNFERMCKLTGRDFAIFSENYFGEKSCFLNPVKDGSSSNIADRLHYAFDWTEEHYSQICRDALQTAISNLKEEGKRITLGRICREIDEISKEGKKKCYRRKDVHGALSRLRKIEHSDFSSKLDGHNALSFQDIRRSRKCVYIGLSVLGHAEIARSLGRVLLGDMAHCAYEAYKKVDPLLSKKNPIGIYIDELSSVITDEFIEVLNKARGAGMELNFAFQSPHDLAKKDENLCMQILENSSNWFILKQRVSKAANLFADAIGTLEGKKQTRRIEDGEEQSLGSQRAVEEFVVHPNVLKNLGIGQCILLRHYPTRIDLLNIKYMRPEILEDNLEFIADHKKNNHFYLN